MNLTATSEPETAAYLRTLPAIRERCGRVFALAKEQKLQYFDYHPDKEAEVAAFCTNIVKRDHGSNLAGIPPHGRWRHLDAGRPRVQPLIESWRKSANPPDDKEITKRLIDLFMVSVLLDAGAGAAWKYTEEQTGKSYNRSEGLGVASFKLFEDGLFCNDSAQPHQVNAAALSQLTPEKIGKGMQVSESNPLVGLEGRTSLLYQLGAALESHPDFFGSDARPGNILDFLETQGKKEGDSYVVPVAALWHAVIEGLASIWPSTRTKFGGLSLGDVWPCDALKPAAVKPGDELVPFHKLTGWLTYSLIEPIEKVLKWKVQGTEDMVGLPEYRNGGLIVDLGVLTPKPGAIPISSESGLPRVPPSHPAIIEWRAMTVIELDRIADLIRQNLGLSPAQLSLAQVLESATWYAGREIAKQKRPETGGPPIETESDGTLF